MIETWSTPVNVCRLELKVDDHLQAGLRPMDKVQPEIRNSSRRKRSICCDYLAEPSEQSNIIVQTGYRELPLMRRQCRK
jgi:hypothetical protein